MTPDEVRKIIREEFQELLASDRYIFHKTLQLLDGRNVIVGKGTGTKIGTEATQKLGFFGTTPTTQISATGATIGMTTPGGATVQEDSAFGGGVGSTKYTIHGIIAALKNLGFLAP